MVAASYSLRLYVLKSFYSERKKYCLLRINYAPPA